MFKKSLPKFLRTIPNDMFNVVDIYGKKLLTIGLPHLKAVLHGTICMIRFVRLLFGFRISSYKSEEIELILSFKNRIIQILMQKVVTIFQFTRSD